MREGGGILSLSKRGWKYNYPSTMANYVYFKFLASSLVGINGMGRDGRLTLRTMRQR